MCNKRINMDNNRLEHLQYTEHTLPIIRMTKILDHYKNGTIDIHWHSEFLFGIVLKGTLDFCFFQNPVSEIHHTLHSGDGVFVNSKVIHGYKQLTPESEIFTFGMLPFYFSPPVFGRLYPNIILPILHSNCQALFFHSGRAGDSNILKLFNNFRLLSVNDKEYELKALETICRIWRALTKAISLPKDLPAPAPSDMGAYHAACLQNMLDFIHIHFKEPITVEQIAQAGSVSKRGCFRYFRSVMNQSPIEYLTQYRLSHAAHLLQTTDDPLSAIAEACGFTTVSYFTKRFKQRYGIVPHEFR